MPRSRRQSRSATGARSHAPLLVVLVALIVAACAPRAGEGPDTGVGDPNRPAPGTDELPAFTGNEQQDQTTLERLRTEARQLARADGCQSAGQCRSAPLGVKPCGGPWEYLVYCSVTTDSTDLYVKLDQVRRYEEELNRRHGRMSDCAMAMEPQLALEGNTCRAR
ncbi:MAG TPA: hypothetical protein VMM18_05990 [Gemmatimonadaceae bacterium]|nr:hypothetical protein [Gemmatimonadaceae bacterium]